LLYVKNVWMLIYMMHIKCSNVSVTLCVFYIFFMFSWNKVTRVSVAIASILGKCDSIKQQDAPHKNKSL
jgi:hypothetical protein